MRTSKLHHRIPIIGRPYLQRNEAYRQREQMRLERDEARRELADARRDRDAANKERDEARKQRDEVRTRLDILRPNSPFEDQMVNDFAAFLANIRDGRDNLGHYFQLYSEYAELYQAYERRGVIMRVDERDKEFGHNIEHYLSVGADALRVIVNALVGNLRSPPTTILDFPSGSGRVTRHLRAFFPNANITVCDLYDYHVQFSADTFAAEGIISQEDLNKVDFGKTFDLIFCGSLVTHLPADLFEATLQLVSRSLTDFGIAIVTLHGRHSEYRQQNLPLKYYDPDLFELADSELHEIGFAYTDYDQGVKRVFDKQFRYGISFSRPHWTMRLLEKDFSRRILGYIERGFDAHQDVLILGGPALNL
jgi:2-polyprenyl-3-methyl-5-hydroxy-6-metoxy-1,4-benzoquinol methylase